MYIIPDTTIKILHNVPLDNTYDHTVYFASEASQISWFNSYTKYTLSAQSYQRLQKGKMRVERRAENLYDCNYIMYQNSSFGNKWFYAFITGVEYINNETSEITFQIDVMQTWYFDYEVDQCFIEREHSSTDVAGDNIVPENLELGEYVIGAETSAEEIINTTKLMLLTSEYIDDSGLAPILKKVNGVFFSRTFFGTQAIFFDPINENNEFVESEVDNLCDYIESLTGLGGGDGILGVFIVPGFLFSSDYGQSMTEPGHFLKNVNKYNNNNYNFQGYTPKNNKLYTYPYNFLYVTNNNGNGAEFPYEYWDDNTSTCQFLISGDVTPNPTLVCIPRHYKGDLFKVDESIALSGFPQCTFNTDAYKAWLAQNSAALIAKGAGTLISTAAGVAAGVASANPVMVGGAIGSGLASILGSLAEIHKASIMPPQNRGQSQSAPLLTMRFLTYTFSRKHITAQFARIIDEFFDRFGYKTNRNKKPNHCNTRFVRPKWGYTKTISCSITGSVPADDMAEICGIYDNGITFWRSNATVCDYTQDNRVGARVQSSNVGSAVSG